MTARYRVGEGGLRVVTPRGAAYSLPPGAVLDEIPYRYQGTLTLVEWDEPKRLGGYEDKRLRPDEDKQPDMGRD